MVKASKVNTRKVVATITAKRMASPHWARPVRLRSPMGMGPTHLCSGLKARRGRVIHGVSTAITCCLKSRSLKAMLVFTL